ncbi:unnamed protein product [Blepharisma stoltei]|uniref:Homeobox domain-containing protein n=1 Tax=Blepharisma stoltei TaxID=1481888 RepID=A0AAU9KC62_9CILI|nr:unnamed protein product [Blepharisma stoltei]
MKTRFQNLREIAIPLPRDKSTKEKFVDCKYEYLSDASDHSNSASTIESPSHKFLKLKRKRNRKSEHQVKILKEEYKINPIWSKEKVVELAKITQLSECQIYKWAWDYKKKLKKDGILESSIKLECEETLVPSMLEYELFMIQRLYKSCTINSIGGPNHCVSSLFAF